MDVPIVYFKPGCPFGIKLRMALTLHGVPHRSVRFRDDEAGAARVREVNDGNEISPTVHLAGQWLTNPGWRDVRDAGTRHPRTRSAAAAAAAAAVISTVLAGCGSNESASTTAAPDQPSNTTETSPAPTVLTAAQADSPLEGTWEAGPITLKDTEATLRRHGLGRWVKDYRMNAPFTGDTVLILTIEKGAWDLYGASDGGQPEPIDYNADYEIDGDTVTFHHSEGSNTYRWEVGDDDLRLHFVRSTLPGYEGIPEEVFQRALYMTATFSRQG
jgi:mycoredoxin